MDKSCPSCGERKSATAYGRNRTQPDGLSFYCLACNRARNQATYARKQARRGRTVRDLSWVPEGFRWCPTCQQAVPEAQYVLSRRTASGFGSQCKPCHRRASNDSYWARRYGMTKNQVAELRAAQDDRCAICGDRSPEHLDHDHDTGRVRALLCQRCNFGLGLYRDDPRLLRSAAEYVERHRARQHRAQPLARRRQEVTSRPESPPVGSSQRPPRSTTSRRSTGLTSMDGRRAAAREAGE